MSFGGGAPAFGAAAKPTFGSTSFSFGSATTSAPTGTFGNFGAAQTSSAGFGFGSNTATTNAGFGTFGSTPATTNPGFSGFSMPASSAANTGFGFGPTQTSTAPAFGAFGQTTTATSTFPTFGAGSNAAGGSLFGAGGNPGFSGFGATNTGFGGGTAGFGGTAAPTFGAPGTAFGSTFGGNAPTFGGNTLGSTFGAKPNTTANFGAFGSTLGGTTAFGQQMQNQQQQPVNPNDALMKAIFNVSIFQDERDQIIAKYNFLQAKWGFGKAYYTPNQFVELTEHNPLCRFKAIDYNCFPQSSDKEGLVQFIFNKSEQEIKSQQQQLQTSLAALLGNKPTLTVTIDSLKPVSESKSQVIIFVVEKSATGGTGTRIPSFELSQFLNGNMQRQQLSQLGVISALPHARPEPRYLQEYLETPPPGIDIRLWKQAQADNPDPDKYFPTPMIGFSEVKWRMKCQEEETQIHASFLSKASEEVTELRAKLASSHAKLQEQRRRFVHLHHRLLTVVVRQESARRSGVAVTGEEEALRSRLEALHSQLSAPTQFNGRLSELLSQMRMQRSQASMQKSDRYSMDKDSQNDIKQYLIMQHKGMAHLIETVNNDMDNLKIMHEGLNKIVQEAE